MRKVNQLSSLKIASLSEPGKYADGLGLYLHISPTGNKSWAFRYMIDGRHASKVSGLYIASTSRKLGSVHAKRGN